MKSTRWAWVAVLVAASASAQDFAVPIDGGITAGVRATLQLAETSDAHSAGFVGAPPSTPLTQSGRALTGTFPTAYVEGHTSISATWTSADRGTIEFQLDGAILTEGCANAVHNDALGLDDWHYTFTAIRSGIFRLGYRLTGTGFGAGGYFVSINGVTLEPGIETPADGSTVTNSRDFPLVAGQTYTFALDNVAGFTTTSSELSGYVSSATFTFELVSAAPEQTQELLEEVRDLELTPGLSSGFSSKLEHVLAALERGDTPVALALLKSFINSVEPQRGKALTDVQADALIAAARAIIDALRSP